jgi:hypothetical protein
MYPSVVNGIYMRDDVLAAFEWRDTFARERRDADYALFPEGGVIEVSEALFFEPADPNERPFAWVRELFDYRAELLKVRRFGVGLDGRALALVAVLVCAPVCAA